MPAMGLGRGTGARFGIDLEHGGARRAEIAHEPVLLQLPVSNRRRSRQDVAIALPSGSRTEGPRTGLADQGGAKVIAKAITLGCLIGGIDRGQGRRGSSGKFGHYAPTPSLRSLASASTAARPLSSWRSRRTPIRASLEPVARLAGSVLDQKLRTLAAEMAQRCPGLVEPVGVDGLRLFWRARSAVAIWVRIFAMASSSSISRRLASGKPWLFAVMETALAGQSWISSAGWGCCRSLPHRGSSGSSRLLVPGSRSDLWRRRGG